MAEVQGLILEAGDGWAIVLLPGGEYKKIKTREPVEVGQLFQLRSYSVVKYVTAAAVFLLIMIASLDFCRVSAWAHISPGIELGLNRWDRVITIKTSDTTGQKTIEDMQIRGRNVEQAVNHIVQKQVSTPGGFSEEEAQLSLWLSTKDLKDKARQEKLFSKIDAALKHNAVDNDPKTPQIKVIRQGNKLVVIDSKENLHGGQKGQESLKDQGNHYGQGRSGSIKPEKSQKALEQPRSGPNGQVNSSAGKKNKDAKSKMEVDKKKTNKIKSEPPGQQKKIKQDEKNSNNKGRS